MNSSSSAVFAAMATADSVIAQHNQPPGSQQHKIRDEMRFEAAKLGRSDVSRMICTASIARKWKKRMSAV